MITFPFNKNQDDAWNLKLFQCFFISREDREEIAKTQICWSQKNEIIAKILFLELWDDDDDNCDEIWLNEFFSAMSFIMGDSRFVSIFKTKRRKGAVHKWRNGLGGVYGFCDDSPKVLVTNRVTMGGGGTKLRDVIYGRPQTRDNPRK